MIDSTPLVTPLFAERTEPCELAGRTVFVAALDFVAGHIDAAGPFCGGVPLAR